MTKKTHLSAAEQAHIAFFVQTAEEERAQPFCAEDEARLLAEMESDEELVRARAVRQICPCRMPWEVFHRFRRMAKRLQNDPSPLVAANARHIEVDARRVADFESRLEMLREHEEEVADQPKRGGRPPHKG